MANEMSMVGKLLECGRCQRRILVEDVLFGVGHTAETSVCCWDCLNEDEKTRARGMYGNLEAEEFS